jgi:hypothetical protein
MYMNLDRDYPVDTIIEIDGGPVLGYYVLMAAWDMIKKDSRGSYRTYVEPGVGYCISTVKTLLNRAYLIDASHATVNPREDYKSFRVCSRYTRMGARHTESDESVLLQSARQFGRDILSSLEDWRVLEPPPLEGFICQFQHENLHQAVTAPAEDGGGWDCPIHAVVGEKFLDWQLLPLFPENP